MTVTPAVEGLSGNTREAVTCAPNAGVVLLMTTPRSRRLLYGAVVLAVLQTLLLADLHDVAVYRAGGQAALHGGAVYGFAQHGLGFTYPPFAALVMSGPAALPLPLLWCALDLASIGALAVIVKLSLPGQWTAARRGDRSAGWRVGSVLFVAPVAQAMRLGQVDILLVALVMADLLIVRRGLLVGLATAIKLTPGLFIVYLIMQRRYREAMTAVGVFAASVGGTAVLLPASSRTYWLHDLLAGTGVGPTDGPGNQSLRGQAVRLFGGHSGTAIWLGLALPTLAAGLILARAAARHDQQVLAVAIVGITACLISPLSWNHHWIWVIPALAGLWSTPWHRRAGLHRWLHAVVVILVAWTAVPWSWQNRTATHYLGTGLVPLALITAAWAAFAASAEQRAACPHPRGRRWRQRVLASWDNTKTG